MEENEKRIKPREYSHIDYEALLIYAMKNHISVEKAIKENGLTISRITVQRNIKRMKEEGNQDLSVIEFYQDVYVPNFQKPEMPEYIKHTIDSFPERQVKMKNVNRFRKIRSQLEEKIKEEREGEEK